jgi:Family of unknown function (DUF6152)
MAHNRQIPMAAVLTIALLLGSGSLLAHHGMSSYDFQRSITVKGTVTKFEFTNPHVLLHFDVKEGNKVVAWIGESGSPNMMRRGGWTKTSVKAGDQVTVIGAPAKNGSPSLRFLKVVLADGRELDPAKGFD